MARPPKKGLDYFPLDCHTDIKVQLLQAAFGLSGFAIFIKLLQRIYADEGYYMMWNEDIGLLFASENNIDRTIVLSVVDECVKRGIFNQEVFRKYSVLTSKGIQERYLTMTEKRTGIKILDDYALLNAPSESVSAEKTGVSSPKTRVSDGRKYTKESKRKEIKEKETKADKSTTTKQKFGEYRHVLLADSEYQKLMDEYPNYQELITFLDEYIEMKGYKAKNHYLAIKKWVVDAVNERHQKNKQLPGWFYEQDEEPQIAQDDIIGDDELMEQLQKLREQHER